MSALVVHPLAAEPETVKLTAVSGDEILLRRAINLEKDCTPMPTPRFVTLNPPANGEISYRQIEARPGYRLDNPRYHCNKREVSARAAFYKAKEGFRGIDQLRFAIVYSDGEAHEFNVEIVVWR